MVEERECATHGVQRHHRERDVGLASGYRWRCNKCRLGYVNKRKALIKATLVAEAGGSCQVCGYQTFLGALTFHHLDPAQKAFSMSKATSKSLAAFREEAKKCVLLCMNCHAEVEGGIIIIGA